MQTVKIKVVLVDDNTTFIRAAMLALSAVPEVQVVGAARSGATALSIVPLKRPDLILMDLNMPDMDGITTALSMRAAGMTVKIVLVSLAEEADTLARKRGFVPDGFIAKANFAEEIQRTVARLFPPGISNANANGEGGQS
jgi:two-component system, NarL family, nitrate/nitrite response regulator NarL